MVRTKRVPSPQGEAGPSTGGATHRSKRTKYEDLPVPPVMTRNFQRDPALYVNILNDDGEDEAVYTGPENKPVMSRLHRAGEKRWLNKEAHALYTKWSNSHDKANYRAVLGGKFIVSDYFVQTGLGVLVTNLIEMGWLAFTEMGNCYDEDLVRQFYANLYTDNGHYHTVVENHIVSFNPAYINHLVGAPDEGSTFCTPGTFSDIVDFEDLKQLFPGQSLASVYRLKMHHFGPFHRIAYALITEIFCPRGGHKTDITHMGLHWMMGVWFRIQINLGAFICKYMLESQMEKKHMLPYGRLIMRIIGDQGVKTALDYDMGSRDVMGADFFKDNHLMLVDGQWLYRRSKMRTGGPGSRTTFIHDDVPDLDPVQTEIPIGPGPSQPAEEMEEEPSTESPLPPDETNVRTREFKSLHHRMTNLERLLAETKRIVDFHITRHWTPEDWAAYQSFQGIPVPAAEGDSDGDSEDSEEEQADDEGQDGGDAGDPSMGGDES